jgi:hypothetical protein
MSILEKLDTAVTEVTAAEQALESVLRELRTGARAEKVKITETVERAFERLRASRIALATLRETPDDQE